MRCIFFVPLLFVITSGCAVLDEDCRRITRSLDSNLTPQSTGAKVALAPIAVPVGFTALAMDGLVINPVCAIPQAFDEASDAAFEKVEFQGLFEIVLFPMRILTFTAVFAGSELLGCTITCDR